MADLPIDDPKAAPSEAVLVEPAPVEEPAPREVDQRKPSDRIAELRQESMAVARVSGIKAVPVGIWPGAKPIREELAVARLTEQLMALLATAEIDQRRAEADAKAERLRQQIVDLGGTPVA